MKKGTRKGVMYMEQFADHINEEQLSIVDGMIDWVRVIDRNSNVYYANKKMKEDLGEDIVGKKCYEIFCRSKKCEDCISYDTLEKGTVSKKESRINDKIYMVISSPMIDDMGKIIGSVEVFRDITVERSLTRKINEKNEKMTEDINFARNMQNRMLPPKGIYNGIKIDYLYESSELLSGDYFDVFKIDKDNTGIYICDVVGHGVTAALLTIFVRQSLRNIARNTSIEMIMKNLHKTILALNLDYDKYFSIFFGIYNKKNHGFDFINAGHNSIPVLFTKNRDIKMLEAKGYPICNIFDSVEYEVNHINLSVGDKLFFYTDGITEARNKDGQEFGAENLIKLIKNEENILDMIKQLLNNYTYIQKDDYAMLVTEII